MSGINAHSDLFDEVAKREQCESEKVISALETTFDHFAIDGNRSVMAEGLLKMGRMEESNVDRNDDRIQVLLQMYYYFLRLLSAR